MLSFTINGEPDNYFKLTIHRLFGFPESTSPFGGYDTESIVEIKSSNYSVKGLIWITTGNIYTFYENLLICQEEVAGTSKLDSYENNLNLAAEYDNYGHVRISGKFQEKHEEENILQFNFRTDQTFINKTLADLRAIFKEYGDNFGIKINN